MTNQEPMIHDLRHSSERIGRLYPILIGKNGHIIDGQHRFAADSHWPTLRLDHIESEKDELLARLISNVCRRVVSAEEKTSILEKLAKIYLEEGEDRRTLVSRIVEETGMSYRWVMKYLPRNLKSRPGLGGPSRWFEKSIDKCKLKSYINAKKNGSICQVARSATFDLAKMLSTSPGRSVIVKSYANTNFVHLTLDKRVYENYESVAENLGVTAETLLGSAIVFLVKEIEKMSLPLCADSAPKARPIMQ